MSEKLQQSLEKLPESIDTSKEARENLERLQAKAEAAEKDPIQNHIESLSKRAELQSISGKEHNVGDRNTEQSTQVFGTNELKADAYKSTLSRTQKSLNAPDRVFSKVIHQRSVDAVSNAAAKTVARPSALLGGGIGAFIGSAILLYVSRQNGFTYNYAAIFALFIAGFLVGMTIELVVKTLTKRR